MSFSKQSAILLILFIAIFFSSCKKEKYDEIDLSVVTYNVAGLPQGLSSSNPVVNSTEIGKLLNEYDVVHVQEDFCYHDSILLNDRHPYVTETTGCVPGGDGLNTFSNFPVTVLERIPWTDCTGADCFTPKGFFHSQITLSNGSVIEFYNVHCNAGSADDSKAARRNNIAQLCSHIKTNTEGKPVVIMGDFNSRYTRDGDTIRALLDMGFTDIWIDKIRGGIVPDLGNSLGDCDPTRTNANCERVDKMFYRSNSKVKITATSYHLDDDRFYYQGNDTLPLSDHWPMFATLHFHIEK